MRNLLFLIPLLWLSACATKPQISYDEASVTGKFPSSWTISGRIAFKSPEDNFSAALNWQQQDQDYQLRLSKLIGGTLMLISSVNGEVTLEVDDERYVDTNAERLLWHNTGWHIPVADFKYWISGRLNPHSRNITNLKQDEAGRIWSFDTASGWQVKYQNYKVFSGTAMPHKLLLKKDGLQLKLRISDWRFETET